MFRTIEKLQQEPVSVRKTVAFLISGIIAFTIAAFWIAAFSVEEKVFTEQTGIMTEVYKMESDTAPFALLKNQWNDLRALLNKKESE